MHFEILIEDQSGKRMLDVLVPNIIGENDTYIIHFYKGIGRIPKGLSSSKDADKRILLDQLPRLLRGYGKTFASYQSGYQAALILVCDLDDKCLKTFRQTLTTTLESCRKKPLTRFCIAIEEGEAWLLGDIPAIKAAYPRAKDAVLAAYKNDSICGTWERLADAVYKGGSANLSKNGWQAVGAEKSKWAEKISPFMQVDKNSSASFAYFRDTLRALSGDHCS
ncbi:MAG: DUF4276 family protein [Spirochaetia bacterium]|nr:DUF4276 family protein [Spirochaetia bacterium]